MSKLSKQDFDDFLGKDPYYSEEDKKLFFDKMQNKKPKRQYVVQKVLSVAVLFIMILGGIQVWNGNLPFFISSDEYKYSNTQGRVIAKSLVDVDLYYYTKTPGLKRAEGLGLVTQVNKTIPITEDANLHIEKIWYNAENTLVFYYIEMPDLKKKLSNPNDPHDLSTFIQYITIHEDENGEFKEEPKVVATGGGPYLKSIHPSYDGVIYENRLYQRAVIENIRSNSDSWEGDVEYVQNLNTKLTSDITVNLLGEVIIINDVELPVHFDFTSDSIIIKTINETNESQYARLTFEKLEIRPEKNLLYGKYELPEGQQFSEINANLVLNGRVIDTIVGYEDVEGDPDSFIFQIPAFNELPDEVTFEIDNVHLFGKDSFEFTMDVSDYEQRLANAESYEKKANEKITEIKDTRVYLERLYYDDRGINFDILYKAKKRKQPLRLIPDVPLNPSFGYDDYSHLRIFVTAENESGEPGEPEDYGQIGSGPGEKYSMFLDRKFIEKSKEVTVTIERLLYSAQIDQSFTVPIKESNN